MSKRSGQVMSNPSGLGNLGAQPAPGAVITAATRALPPSPCAVSRWSAVSPDAAAHSAMCRDKAR